MKNKSFNTTISYKNRSPLHISASPPFLTKFQAPQKLKNEKNKQLLWLSIIGFIAVYLFTVSLYKETCSAHNEEEKNKNIRFFQEEEEEEVEKVVEQVKDMRVNGVHHNKDTMIDLFQGDPTMFEAFWRAMGEQIIIPLWQKLSYYSDASNLCWFLEPEFAHEILRLHKLVGNVVTEDRHIVVGTGSTQLFQAALYALSPSDASEPMSVVSAKPYYSSYPTITDMLKSGLYKWAGDANSFKGDSYIEIVCAPNNPDGNMNKAVLNSKNGKIIHDFAYYWPQYTAITEATDHDITLFTVSKTTGHAGTRLGWALVKDPDVAMKMTKFIELNTIGVSKHSQRIAAKLMKVVCDGYELPVPNPNARIFEFGKRTLEKRWKKLREVAKETGMFSLPEYPYNTCKFTGERTTTTPAFAWLKCEKDIEDCASFLMSHKIKIRGGMHFGMDPKYVRVSMVDRDETFDLFIERLTSLN